MSDTSETDAITFSICLNDPCSQVATLEDLCRKLEMERNELRQVVDSLNALIDRIKDQDLEVYSAAHAVVARWDTEIWKNAAPTSMFINRLRNALKDKEP